MTTWLQHHDHVIERCDASTGHSVLPIAYCRDTATARLLVDAANNYERVISENDKLREALSRVLVGVCPSSVQQQRLADNLEALCHEVYDIVRAAMAEGGAR